VVVPWCSKNQHLAVLDTKDRQALTKSDPSFGIQIDWIPILITLTPKKPSILGDPQYHYTFIQSFHGSSNVFRPWKI
jgi:hypothetical protein